ncbi:hypothetical protein P3628_21150, partial [Vibrio parahaemolyticus]|nr:hypothetical protein [Vibrio parahaemolyticus]MDF5133730.1 hypothetical protein [Vibrio parahaemolyticus]MDF5266462.1 hypothetical protein [Vibrio parahaemolyticus]MDF5271152.1 hypothetical protein [Vibrio parahaemolyticus]
CAFGLNRNRCSGHTEMAVRNAPKYAGKTKEQEFDLSIYHELTDLRLYIPIQDLHLGKDAQKLDGRQRYPGGTALS